LTNWQIQKIVNNIASSEFNNKQNFNVLEVVKIFELMMANNYEKPTLNRGYDKFRYFANYLFQRATRNFDNMILLTGVKGAGKSSAGIMLAREWCKIMGKPLVPERDIVYTNKQLIKRIDEASPWSVILCDEAINFATAENWNKPENKELKIKLGTVRTKHILFILALPWKIKKLDKVYFDSYINYWIDLYERGEGAVFVKDLNPSGDPWKLKNFEDLGAYNEFTTPEQVKKKLEKHPNFWTMMKIPNVPKKLYDRYLVVRESNVYNHGDVISSVNQKDGVIALMLKALYDITLKGSTGTIKRLAKHFEEKYNVNIPIKLIESIFADSEQLSERIMQDGGIEGLKK